MFGKRPDESATTYPTRRWQQRASQAHSVAVRALSRSKRVRAHRKSAQRYAMSGPTSSTEIMKNTGIVDVIWRLHAAFESRPWA